MIKKGMFILTVFLLSGCWDYRELNELAIVGAVAIDIVGNEYIVGAQILNPSTDGAQDSKSGASSGVPVVVYKSKGKTIHEAFRKIVKESPHKLYIGHISIVMVSDLAARQGFKEISDFLLRDQETRKQFEVIVLRKGNVKESISILTHLESLPSRSLLDSLNSSAEFYGQVATFGLDEFLSFEYAEGIEPTLPFADLEGKIEEGTKKESTEETTLDFFVKLKGMGVFKGDKLVGYLSENESIGYNFIMGNLKSSIIPFKCDKDNYASVEIVKYKPGFKVEIRKNKPLVKIELTGDAIQSEINCNVDMENLEERSETQKLMNNAIKKLIESSINKVKEDYGSDIFGFGQYLYRHNYKYWQKNRDNWDEVFKNIEYEVKVNLRLVKKGSILNSTKVGVRNGK